MLCLNKGARPVDILQLKSFGQAPLPQDRDEGAGSFLAILVGKSSLSPSLRVQGLRALRGLGLGFRV